ncbi:hypothetical protein TBLA_0J02060 [Henningerozyma blattae CBS 6284]|uniref:N-glycosylation protein EOS1 n=1 Tax=Henningerozyma blattae (strain ATCC 34711 / CBS 6284 / DSM 70876 / NBRC 10599 / NRRL Y-10934 / UCD 77-7) TaxID=1071380 RepID=I2H9Z8_HENB6|nr:hypothetical protein TBLA_0J02060 [Tetrapisispora blattae CBS 6284]CCH63200.1 hypothetical protein TBLA_0J02060 [Tetrapisispora blattae CBS 6284]
MHLHSTNLSNDLYSINTFQSSIENNDSRRSISSLSHLNGSSQTSPQTLPSQASLIYTNSTTLAKAYSSMKTLSLSHLTAKQHFLMALCRDVSLLPPIINIFQSLKKSWSLLSSNQDIFNTINPTHITAMFSLHFNSQNNISSISNISSTNNTINYDNILIQSLTNLTRANASEYFLCSIWSSVSLYLTYATLDSLMIRWIVKYSTLAAILRMFSMSLLILTIESLLINSFSLDSDYYLHVWIIISCILTIVFIWQSYITSNLNYVNHQSNEKDIDSNDDSLSNSSSNSIDSHVYSRRQKKLKKKNKKIFLVSKKRTIDLYKIIVFCVVPVGIASFLTMVGILRNLFIQRIDIEELTFLLNGSMQIHQ